MTPRTQCRVCATPTDAFLCRPCTSELERALAETQSMRHELSILATGQTRIYRTGGISAAEKELQAADAALAEAWDTEQRRRESRIAPAHRSRADRIALPATRAMVNLAARDLLTDLDTNLVGWARVLHEHTDTPWQLDTTEQVVTWLTAHVDAFRWHEAAAEAHTEITTAHRYAQRAVDRAPSRVYAGPCHAEQADTGRCTRPLYAQNPPRFTDELDRALWWEANPIVCDGYRPPFDRSEGYVAGDTGCGAQHGRDDRRSWMVGEVEDRLLPLSLLQDTLPSLLPDLVWPARSTWWKWARPTESGARMLWPKTVIDGVEFFRGGDVIDLVTRQQGRIVGNATAHRTRQRHRPTG